MQNFGGTWTEDKLVRVKKYLEAYTKILSKTDLRFAYVDTFAGTGYRNLREDNGELTLPEFEEEDSKEFLDGSVKIALDVSPHFHKYIFIENDKDKYIELTKIKKQYLELIIEIKNTEANSYISDFCSKVNWKNHRAVIFLDPFGMQVTWETINLISQTKAIDLWLLFPLGVAVNRLLKKDGKINEENKKKLNSFFGVSDWFDIFYIKNKSDTLFGPDKKTEKNANFQLISEYFVKRLRTIFPGVAEKPLPLFNSKNNRLYLLCFASGNPKGSKTAVKIANYILNKGNPYA